MKEQNLLCLFRNHFITFGNIQQILRNPEISVSLQKIVQGPKLAIHPLKIAGVRMSCVLKISRSVSEILANYA